LVPPTIPEKGRTAARAQAFSTRLTRTRHFRSSPVTEISSTSLDRGRGPCHVRERKNFKAFLAASDTVFAVTLVS
jgi:hypothetical protein